MRSSSRPQRPILRIVGMMYRAKRKLCILAKKKKLEFGVIPAFKFSWCEISLILSFNKKVCIWKKNYGCFFSHDKFSLLFDVNTHTAQRTQNAESKSGKTMWIVKFLVMTKYGTITLVIWQDGKFWQSGNLLDSRSLTWDEKKLFFEEILQVLWTLRRIWWSNINRYVFMHIFFF